MRMHRHKENGNYATRSGGGSRGGGGHAGLILALAALIALIFAALEEWTKKRQSKLEAAKKVKQPNDARPTKLGL